MDLSLLNSFKFASVGRHTEQLLEAEVYNWRYLRVIDRDDLSKVGLIFVEAKIVSSL